LAQKDKTLVEKDQKLKLYGELIAALQGENSNLKLLVQEMKERGDRYQAGLSHVTRVLQEMKEGGDMFKRVLQEMKEGGDMYKAALAGLADASEGVAVVLPTPSPPPPPRPHQEVSLPHQHGRLSQPHQPITASAPAPPPSRPAGVSLVTFAWKDFKEMSDMCLKAELYRRHQVHADVVLDVRCFNDPEQHRFGRGHTGMHSQILTRIVGHELFHHWFMESINRIRVATLQVRRDNRDVGVAVYCNAGKHRSVACSIFLAVSLPTFGFAVAGPPMHLAQPSWPKSDFCQGGCEDCRNAFDTAQRLLIERKVYQSMHHCIP